MAAVTQDRPTRIGLVTGLTFVGALVVALVVRGSAVVGIAALFLLFVPLEKLFALSSGASTPYTTASRRWTGWPPVDSIPSTRRSHRRSP